ncbi:hypothetical protein [Pollutibacter soli]|uniref:hypothetical protein n=1 Tax=Pollutibacter soli TaxID=3034157 RepID=UPI003013C69C
MDRYLLLRSNVQTGPHTFENLVKLGLNSQDLIWIDGRSNSWRYPTEMDEFKKFISSTSNTDIGFDKPPMSRTRLQNDYILIKGLTEKSVIGNRHIPEQELFEFPTLARFFMAEKYREMPAPVALIQETKMLEPLFKADDANIPKSKVWVSYPSTATKKRVVVIRSITEKQKEEKKAAPVITIARPAAAVLIKEIKDKEVAELKPVVTTPPVVIRIGETFAPVDEVPVSQAHEPAGMVIKNGFAAIQHRPESFSFSQEPVIEKIHFAGSRFRKPFSFSLQSLAVAVALASLMMVGLLIANSIINPAYELKTLNSNRSTIPEKAEKNNAGAAVSASTVPIAVPVADPPPLTPTNLQVENNGPPAAENKTTAEEKKIVVSKKTKDKKPVPAMVAPVMAPTEEIITADESGTKKEETNNEAVEKEGSIKNIAQLVQVKMSEYRTGLFGGIKEFDLVVKNNSNYPLDHVTVELTYIQANKKVYKTETVQFASIAPQSQKSIEIPKSARGVKVESMIRSIASGELSYSK